MMLYRDLNFQVHTPPLKRKSTVLQPGDSGLRPKEKRKRQRSSRRLEAEVVKPRLEGSLLRASSVGPETLSRYQEHWKKFRAWTTQEKMSLKNEASVDLALTHYLDHLWMEGEDLSAANYAKASILFHRPDLKGRGSLSRASQALKGWRRLAPPQSRMPLPYEVITLLALDAVNLGKVEIALVLLLNFVLYLRPGEFEALRVGDIIRPVKRGGPIYQFWSILLHPQEEGVPSKTQQWDEALTLDLAYYSFLGPAMDKHLRLRSRSKGSKAFAIQLKEVNDFMEERWKHHKLQALKKPHLYRLRHGGASHELGGKLRTIQEVQIRGRWLCTKSLKNYEKAGRMAQLLGSLEEAKQQECVRSREEIGKALLGQR